MHLVSSRHDSNFNQSFDSVQNDPVDSEAALSVFRKQFQSTKLYDIDDVIAQFIAKVEDADDHRLLEEDKTTDSDAFKIAN